MSKLSELLAAAKAAKQNQSNLQTTPSPTQHNQLNPIAASIQQIGDSNHERLIQDIRSAGDSNSGIDNTSTKTIHSGIGKHGEAINYNTEQWQFIQTVLSGKSCILIGAAGTGKTTSTRGAISSLLQQSYIPPITENHKHLSVGSPSIVAASYTRRAVMNLRQAMPPELAGNCITIHKLLEYQPVFYEVEDPVSGEFKKTMKFEPNRNQYNPLPSSIRTFVLDESSMISVDLFHKIWVAIDPEVRPYCQFIFLGDIQQLPPVFGSAILGYKMLKLPVIELTQVYRQALESPIIRLAHRILSGESIKVSEFPEWEVPNKLKLHPWKKRISADHALQTVQKFFKQAYDSQNYDPEQDMILIPFNKALGTDEVNRSIANHIARKHNRLTYEVIAGFNKYYFSEGEKVLYEKEDAEIISIKRNPVYAGKWPQSPSTNLDYWGCLQESETEEIDHSLGEDGESESDIDGMLEALVNSDVEDRVREASHILTVKMKDSERTIEIKSASEINSLIMAYALTIHKSQGSEWRKVFVILHNSHNTMIQRELLYTACTRARENLYVICEPDSFEKGIQGQRIKGNTLKEKALHFQGKLERGEETFLQEIL